MDNSDSGYDRQISNRSLVCRHLRVRWRAHAYGGQK